MRYVRPVNYEVLELRDGRLLEYATNGLPRASSVIFHQGTLNDLCQWRSWLVELKNRELGAVAFNRSGYGRSSAKEGRCAIDIGNDVRELADLLDLEHYVSVGWSGGGPHALATAFDPRCKGVVTLAGLAPFNQPDLDFYEGMKQNDVDEYTAALHDINDLIIRLEAGAGNDEFCTPDEHAIAMPSFEEIAAAILRTKEFGLRCIVDDYSSYLSPWGFSVTGIQVPVIVFQGGLDENVPFGHARWLASKIPNAVLNSKPGEGHISLILNNRGEIVREAIRLLGA